MIRAGQQLGLSLAHLRDLLAVRDGGPCAEVRARLRPLLAARITLARTRARDLADSIARLEQALSATDPAPPSGPCQPGCGCLTDSSLSQRSPLPRKSPEPHQTQRPVACGLGGDDQQGRLAEWRDLVARATARQPVPDGVRVTLPAALAGTAAELAAAEQACCPFFRFALDFEGGAVQLTVQVPAAAAPLLAALFSPDPADETGASVSS